ncbi:MAG: nucleotidyltransferase substrate binding protein [Deltaproteobacteria bacterium]|nr:nucleotidyltransferase substrate binding protein [Deltaproteobacteria bacterium]
MSSKFQATLHHFERAVGKLSDVLEQEKNEYIRDSAIQRFEFTFELAWKTLKAFLEEQGITVYSPRDSFKGAFQTGLIDEEPTWLETIELRNLTTHTYNESTAEAIYDALPRVLVLYKKLLESLKARP